MSKITIIQLLNKIANGEEVPKMIKYDGNIYYKKRNVYKHTNYYESEYNNLLIADIQNSNQLNDLVETSGEEKKLPEKLGYCEENTFSIRETGMTKKDRRLLDSNFKELGNKINFIIDYLESKEKGE